jgi:hypothetical protein
VNERLTHHSKMQIVPQTWNKSMSDVSHSRRGRAAGKSGLVRYAPGSDQIQHRGELTRCANIGHTQSMSGLSCSRLTFCSPIMGGAPDRTALVLIDRGLRSVGPLVHRYLSSTPTLVSARAGSAAAIFM